MISATLLQLPGLQTLDLRSFAQISAERMLNCAAEGIGDRSFWRGSCCASWGGRTRVRDFAVWFSALVGIAALPVLGHFGAAAARWRNRPRSPCPLHGQLTYLWAGR